MTIRKLRVGAVLAVVCSLAATAVMAAPSWGAPPPTPCTGPLGAVTITGTVSAGAGCDLSETTVNGSVTVNPGGSLLTNIHTAITGGVHGNEASSIRLLSSKIGGNVVLVGTTNFVEIEDGTVNGRISVTGGEAITVVVGEAVQGDVLIEGTSNTGTETEFCCVVGVDFNQIAGHLEVRNNSLTGGPRGIIEIARNSVGRLLRVNNNSIGNVNSAIFLWRNQVGGVIALVENLGGEETDVGENTTTHTLVCRKNTPAPKLFEAPFGGGNTASELLGQCRGL